MPLNNHSENGGFVGSLCVIIQEKITFTVPKCPIVFIWERQHWTFPVYAFFYSAFTQLHQLSSSVMGTCCVYDEYWPICLPLEGKHIWHLMLTLSLLLRCLFFWQRWIWVLFLISSHSMMLVNKASLLGHICIHMFHWDIHIWGVLIINMKCSDHSVLKQAGH